MDFRDKLKQVIRDTRDNPQKHCSKTDCRAYGKNPMALPCSACTWRLPIDMYVKK